MQQGVSLWCPVIVDRLPAPIRLRQEHRYDLGDRCERIDDIRVKILSASAIRQGKYVQAVIQLEAVILIEDRYGHTGILSRPVHIRERVNWPGMNKSLLDDCWISFVLHMEKLQWDPEFLDAEITIRYEIDYTVYAVREQPVQIHMDQDELERNVDPAGVGKDVNDEMSRIQNENQALNRRLVHYQKDMLSLQHGIKKVEERNAQLFRELNGTREKVQQLQEAITRKDLLISRYQQIGGNGGRQDKVMLQPPKSTESRLGERIKKLIMSCL